MGLMVEAGKSIKFPSGFFSEVKKMNGMAQNALANKQMIKDGTAFDEVIKQCIPYAATSKIEDWLVGDKFFAILAIRIVTYGPKFSFRVKCPFCDEVNTFWIDLTELDIKYLDNKPTENIEFIIPGINKKVTFHLLKGKHEKLMKEVAKKKSDSIITSLMALRVDKIEGEEMVDEDFFKTMDADNILAFRDYIDECDCGVDTGLILSCPDCDAEFEEELQLDSDFFFPKKAKKK